MVHRASSPDFPSPPVEPLTGERTIGGGWDPDSYWALMIELPENTQHSQGTLRAPVMMAVIAVMISLFPLLFGCSSERSKDQADEGQRASATRGGQTGNAGEGSKGARRTETQAALVPIAHLSSTADNISTQELSGTRNLAVGRGYRDEAEALTDSPRFESLDSAAAVVDHVSKTPEALGLVPWDEVGPRVKAL